MFGGNDDFDLGTVRSLDGDNMPRLRGDLSGQFYGLRLVIELEKEDLLFTCRKPGGLFPSFFSERAEPILKGYSVFETASLHGAAPIPIGVWAEA
jgi:hypothetical protein